MDDAYAISPDTWTIAHRGDAYQLDIQGPKNEETIIDDYEDNNLSEYNASDPANTWTIKRSNSMSGDYLLYGRGAETGYNSWLMSDLSLPNLPVRGETMSFDWEVRSSMPSADNSKFFFIFGAQDLHSGYHNHYAVEHEVGSDEIDIEIDQGGTDISLGDQVVVFDNYTRYRTTIAWDPDGSGRIRIHIRNIENGNVLTEYWSSSDTTFDSGGIGFYIRHELNVWIDDVILRYDN